MKILVCEGRCSPATALYDAAIHAYHREWPPWANNDSLDEQQEHLQLVGKRVMAHLTCWSCPEATPLGFAVAPARRLRLALFGSMALSG